MAVTVKATVTEALPGAKFRVTCENGWQAVCRVSGRLQKGKIRILLDDVVDAELSEYDLAQGRITYRYK